MFERLYKELVSELAEAREELFSYERSEMTGMFADPSIVIVEMKREIKKLREELK